VLVAVESVQAVELASRHTGEHADPNGELMVQAGVNVATGFAGGLPACGVSSYSSENALLGAQTPLAGILQSVLLVGLLFLFAPFLPLVPLTVISALIVSSVCTLTHWRELAQVIKPGAVEVGAWLATSALTIVDLPFGVAVGLLIGMFLYIREQKTVRLGAPR
jgi:SulP family sulfate permease